MMQDKLIDFELLSDIVRIMNDDVQNYELSELADIRQGHPFRGAIAEEPDGSIAVIQMKDVSRSGIKPREDLIRTEIQGRRVPDWLQDGDILLVARGASNYACIIPNAPARTVCSPHLYVLRLKHSGKVLPEFLAWQLNQTAAQRYLTQAAEGSSQLSIRKPVLEQLPIKLPPIHQQQIISELSRLAATEQHLLQTMIRNRDMQLAAIAERLLG